MLCNQWIWPNALWLVNCEHKLKGRVLSSAPITTEFLACFGNYICCPKLSADGQEFKHACLKWKTSIQSNKLNLHQRISSSLIEDYVVSVPTNRTQKEKLLQFSLHLSLFHFKILQMRTIQVVVCAKVKNLIFESVKVSKFLPFLSWEPNVIPNSATEQAHWSLCKLRQ